MNSNNWWNFEIDDNTYKAFASALGCAGELKERDQIAVQIVCWFANEHGYDYAKSDPKDILDKILIHTAGAKDYSKYVQLLVSRCAGKLSNWYKEWVEKNKNESEVLFGECVMNGVGHWYVSLIGSDFIDSKGFNDCMKGVLRNYIMEYKVSDRSKMFLRSIIIALFSGIDTMRKLGAGEVARDITVLSTNPFRVMPVYLSKPFIDKTRYGRSCCTANNCINKIFDAESLTILDNYYKRYGKLMEGFTAYELLNNFIHDAGKDFKELIN